MPAPVQYANSPITEAIIDLRVGSMEQFDRALLKLNGAAGLVGYEKHDEIIEAIGQLAVGPGGGSASVEQSPIGWKLSSSDRKQIAQSRINGFTFSRLAPYHRWELFRDEARQLWSLYRQKVNPARIERLAVRYINRIDIPGNQVDLKEYFRTTPEIAPELPQALNAYFMQIRLPYPDIGGQCLINQTIVRPAREGVVSVVLDIDLFRDQDVPQSEEAIWEFFETMHDSKNHVFEMCITDATRRLFTCQS